jgi:hypothetical protein
MLCPGICNYYSCWATYYCYSTSKIIISLLKATANILNLLKESQFVFMLCPGICNTCSWSAASKEESEEKHHWDSQPTPDAFAGASFSQHANESSQQTTRQSQQVASSMTIPIEGRLKWWVFGNENSSRQDGGLPKRAPHDESPGRLRGQVGAAHWPIWHQPGLGIGKYLASGEGLWPGAGQRVAVWDG